MRILVAPDKFKGSLTAPQAAQAIRAGIAALDPTIKVDLCPIADGGEGTIATLKHAYQTQGQTLEEYTVQVTGPLSAQPPLAAAYLLLAGTGKHPTTPHQFPIAIIELATASGLNKIPQNQTPNPLHTTTRGTGQLINHALQKGARTIIIALGGSATCDAACGLAQALGAEFTLDNKQQFTTNNDTIVTGQHLSYLKTIDTTKLDSKITHTQFIALCDVQNPLLGPNGAAPVYAPQKGAAPADVQLLEAGLAHLTQLLPSHIDHTQLMMGAAGGAAYGLAAFVNAQLAPGIDFILDTCNFTHRLAQADLLITGEGQLDAQTLQGKALLGVAKRARSQNKPTLAIVGNIDSNLTTDQHTTLASYLTNYSSLTEMPGIHSIQTATQRASELLCAQTEITLAKYLLPGSSI